MFRWVDRWQTLGGADEPATRGLLEQRDRELEDYLNVPPFGVAARAVAVTAVAAGATTALTFDTFDMGSKAFLAVPATEVTIPASSDDLYSAFAFVSGSGAAGATDWAILGDALGTPLAIAAFEPATASVSLTFGPLYLVAGQTISVTVHNSAAGSRDFVGWLDVWRVRR